LNWLRSQRLAKLGADLEGHDSPLRSGECHAAERVPERASQGRGTGATIAKQQEQIKALTAGLQKVTARVEAANSLARVVSDN